MELKYACFGGLKVGLISPGYLKDYGVQGVRSALAEASPKRQPEWRATPNSPGTYGSPA